ncbi:MAG TPA: hypothetical protein VFR66_12500 [Burkholderiales bacterium]|nr:hypothetical protein [Burkholderiales bacterium]
MKTLLAVLLAGVAGTAAAAPRAESATECGIAADMAVVARSLAQEEIKPPQAGAIMARIYDVSDSARGKELMKDIIDAAYRKNGDSSQKFAEELFTACMKDGGNMDTVLGKAL